MLLFRFFFLFVLQFLSGFGLLNLVAPVKNRVQSVTLSVMAGMFLSTFAIYLTEIFHLGISWENLLIVQSIFVLGLNLRFKHSLKALEELILPFRFHVKVYDLPILGFLGYIVFISAWRAWYLPVTSFDSVNGIDLLAKFAVKEGTIVSSVFNKEIISGLSTQVYYAPFTSFMQIVYRLCGFPWGQVWLTMVFVCFALFFYSKMSEKVHPVLAGLLTILIFITPELFAYSFLLQTDFSNALFFGVGVIYFTEYWESEQKQDLYRSVLFMLIAVWTRSETVFFLPFASALLLFKQIKKGNAIKGLSEGILFTAVPAIAFLLWNIVFYKFYFPFAPDTAAELKTPDYSWANITHIISDMNNLVVFANDYWGYGLYLFGVCLALNLWIYKDKRSLVIVFWLGVMYFVFLMLKIHLIHIEVTMTFRRGFFKFIVLFYTYIAYTQLARVFSDRVKRWEKA